MRGNSITRSQPRRISGGGPITRTGQPAAFRQFSARITSLVFSKIRMPRSARGGVAAFPAARLRPFFKNEKRVVATYSGSLLEQDRVAAMLFEGRLDPTPLVTHRIPLDRADEAVRLARSRQALKIMIMPPADGAAGR